MINYNFKQLIKKGVHLGHYKWESDYKLSFFLLGLRNSLHIININYTIYVLRRVLHIVYNVSKLSQKILIVNNNSYNTLFNKKFFSHKPFLYVNKKWKGGLLTNHKNIRKYNFKLFNNYLSLKNMYILPSFIFVSNYNETNSSIYESIILNIPTSSLIDTDNTLYGIHYGIPSNNQSIITKNFFNLLFIKTSLEALCDNIRSIYQFKKKKILKKKHENLKVNTKKKIKKNFNKNFLNKKKNNLIPKKNLKDLKINKI